MTRKDILYSVVLLLGLSHSAHAQANFTTVKQSTVQVVDTINSPAAAGTGSNWGLSWSKSSNAYTGSLIPDTAKGATITSAGIGVKIDGTLAVAGQAIGLKLNNSNTWTALQSFTAGISPTTVKADPGSVAAPTFTFSNNTNTGMYQKGSGSIGFTTLGVTAAYFDNKGLTLDSGQFLGGVGNAATPTYSLRPDADTGMYDIAANTIGFSTAGVERMRIDASGGVTVTQSTNARGFRVSGTQASGSPETVDCETTKINSRSIIGATNSGSAGAVIDLRAHGNGYTESIFDSSTAGSASGCVVLGQPGAGGYMSVGTYTNTPMYLGANRLYCCFIDTAGDLNMKSGRQIAADAGTVSEPGYSWVGDLDTGIYHSANDTMDFSAGGVNKMTVNANGVTFSKRVIRTPSTTLNITTTVGIDAVANPQSVFLIQGDGAAVDITADPQISGGSNGQMLILVGMSNTNTVKLDNGTGLVMGGGTSFTLGLNDTISFIYLVTPAVWIELSRVNN